MSVSPREAYEQLIHRERDRQVLLSCAGLLGWDERTYCPPAGVAHRGQQLGLLARLAHEQLTSPRTGELLAMAEADPQLSGGDGEPAANLRELRRAYDRAVKIPTRLVEALAHATSRGQQVWEHARPRNDFEGFLPSLGHILDLKREEAQAVGFPSEPYDALLDEYEPGLTAAEAARVLGELRGPLSELTQAMLNSGRTAPRDLLSRAYPVERQRHLGHMVAALVGFDFHGGRLDVTAHPFCSGHGPGDVRITTRYNEHAFAESFFGILHEVGHGIYEQNLPAEKFGTPCGTACSLGIHESQSRLWENFVGRSREFWEYIFPQARAVFPEALGDVSLDDFHFAINDVCPSYIRIEADEVTYNLHILLRFELERAMLKGTLHPADLPAAWNETLKALLGLPGPPHGQGCLQDVHWSAGLLGYFPTYSLGNLYAAQFMEQAHGDLGDLAGDIRAGRFGRLKEWLVTHIHRHGQRFRAAELCQRITGRPLSAEPLLRHQRRRFGPLYGLS